MRGSFTVKKITGHHSRPDTEPALRLSEEKKLKNKNLTGKKSLTLISKSLFDLNVKGYQEKFWAAILLSSWMHFMCVRSEYLKEGFCVK